MARIPYVDPETASAEVRATLQRLPVQLNIFRVMAHAESDFRPMLRLGTSILGRQKLGGKLRELAILLIASLSEAEYEWVQHVPVGKAAGVTAAQIEALRRGGIGAACFDTNERLLLQFTTEVVRDAGASADTVRAMAACFSPREIVELILAIGYYMTIARLARTLDVDLDDPAGTKLMDAVK